MSTVTETKRRRGETPDESKSATMYTTLPAYKRQRKEANSTQTHASPVIPAADSIPAALNRIVPNSYKQLLPDTPQAIAFLFHQQFSEALDTPAQIVATQNGITKENAIEELRRFLAIKTFVHDEFASKISPTPLSKHLYLFICLS